MFYGEGRVEAVVRTCERHERSEKVSVCETGMPYVGSGENNFLPKILAVRQPLDLISMMK